MSKNKNLHIAKKEKNDEFYTMYEDIEKELKEYKDQLKDKIIYCNCDNPEYSNFWKYLSDNFEYYELKKLISSHYNPNGNSYKLEINRDNDGILNTQKTIFKGNGDFRSDECIEILKRCDIVITNAPFSLFREYINQLMEHDKKFLVIGNQNAITYKEVFKYIKANRLWLGVNQRIMNFIKPNGEIQKFGNICWFTNLNIKKRYKDLILSKKYTPEEYPKYDNYDAINVDKVKDIPVDYFGYMGVPITYLYYHKPEQFELVGMGEDNGSGYSGGVWEGGSRSCLVNGKAVFKRLFIKRNEVDYPKYDNYDAINIDKVANIPVDYFGYMGVPISYLNKHNPEQFEIITLGIVGTCDFTCNKKMEILDKNGNPTGKFTFNAKGTLYKLYNPKTDKSPAFRNVETNELYTSIYARIIIKRK